MQLLVWIVGKLSPTGRYGQDFSLYLEWLSGDAKGFREIAGPGRGAAPESGADH
jgi:hypothetical protein